MEIGIYILEITTNWGLNRLIVAFSALLIGLLIAGGISWHQARSAKKQLPSEKSLSTTPKFIPYIKTP